MPIYIVTDRKTNEARLVQAHTKAQAIRHVAADTLAIEAATAVTVGRLMSDGAKLEYVPEAAQQELPGIGE